MLIARPSAAAALLLFALAPGVHAASSDWHHVQGGSIRIVTSGVPDAEGTLRGALEIRLKPGWKTYWLDPGSSGVPPTLDVTIGDEAAAVEIGFPAPQRFDDGYALWAGYDGPVRLALTLRLPHDRPEPARVEANTFLGVCETICIPVQAELTFDPYEDTDDPEHRQAVEAAFAALPRPARDGFGAEAVEVKDDAILIEATLPDGQEAMDLFVAGTETLILGVPERVAGTDDAPLFSVPVIDRREGGGGGELRYTLLTRAGAVAGTLSLR